MAVACHRASTGCWGGMPGGGTWRLLALPLPRPARRMLQLRSKIVFLLELIRNEARVVVSVGEIKGVPDPSALQQLEVGSEAPEITYRYCVTYEFVEGEDIGDGSSTEVCA